MLDLEAPKDNLVPEVKVGLEIIMEALLELMEIMVAAHQVEDLVHLEVEVLELYQ
jgi:hypothetical protein